MLVLSSTGCTNIFLSNGWPKSRALQLTPVSGCARSINTDLAERTADNLWMSSSLRVAISNPSYLQITSYRSHVAAQSHAPDPFSKNKKRDSRTEPLVLHVTQSPYILLHVPAATCVPPSCVSKTCFRIGCPQTAYHRKLLKECEKKSALIGLNHRRSAGKLPQTRGVPHPRYANPHPLQVSAGSCTGYGGTDWALRWHCVRLVTGRR